MNAVDYLKAKDRMTKECRIRCDECPLSKDINGKGIDCMWLKRNYPEQAVEIVEKWAKEHPVKTYLSVLLEKFPNARMHNDSGIPFPTICPHSIFNIEERCPPTHCVDCWNREYKEEI